MIVIEPRDALIRFVCEISGGGVHDYEPCQPIGSTKADGSLAGVVLIHGYNKDCGVAEVSAAGAGFWVSARLWGFVINYAYRELGVHTLFARCGQDNTKVIRFWEASGARGHVIPDLRGRAGAEVILVLTESDFRASKIGRWIHGKYFQQSARAA